ncbi:hypothetical protein P3T37_003331 [Kitasatospora sp. MAA4]|uniref:DUF5994 family protein n=1 Tax=Kitasatospora sp. MAA4 TaxID=3035093 RepID=UPI002476847D|nr:DUF5994 family protein [Kitasatospora sp. MAA4]MDH6133932.1 hypothetical protein [Kitasatospora sp. MAA4]
MVSKSTASNDLPLRPYRTSRRHLSPLYPLPSRPRLSLEPTLTRAGMFDGAWWPRSRDVEAELPCLITALTAHLGHISRVGLDTSGWDDIPRCLTVDGLAIRIGRFSAGADTVSVTRSLDDHFLLLVVPPWATATEAATAMTAAARPGNRATAAQLLAPPRQFLAEPTT